MRTLIASVIVGLSFSALPAEAKTIDLAKPLIRGGISLTKATCPAGYDLEITAEATNERWVWVPIARRRDYDNRRKEKRRVFDLVTSSRCVPPQQTPIVERPR